MVGRVATREEAGARLGIVRQNNPRGCVRPGRVAPPSERAGFDRWMTGLGWLALAVLAAGLVMLAAS